MGLRHAILEKHRDHNVIRILILKVLHLLLTQGKNNDALIKEINLKELLTTLSQDKSVVMVHRLAEALYLQFIERDETGGRNYSKKKTKKCMICQSKFTILSKKYYCKQCQLVVCSSCSP